MEGKIYKITNKINNKVYIGQTVMSLDFRWNQHKNKKDNCHFHNAIRKYGEHNFIIEEIEKCPIKNLNEREIYYIDKYNSFRNGYNSTLGGDGKRLELYIDNNAINNIIELYTISLYSCYKIAKEYEVDKASIRKLLKACNIQIRSPKRFELNNEEFLELKELYNTGHSLKSLGRLYDVASSTIKEYLIKNNVDLREKYSILQDFNQHDKIIDRWVNSSDSIEKITKDFHISFGIFKKILSIHKIDDKKSHFKLNDNQCLDIIYLYNNGSKIKTISKQYKVDYSTIKNVLIRYNILKTV